jgi:hypothetical protein
MDVQFRWTESDYFAAQLAWMYRRPWRILFGFKYSILLLFIVAAALVMKPENWRNELIGIMLAAVIATPEILRTWRRWHRHFKKFYATDVEYIATIDERGVTLAAQGQQKTDSWTGFSRIYESRRVILFEKGADRLLFLPKTAMSGAQLGELRRLAVTAPNCKVRLAAPTG